MIVEPDILLAAEEEEGKGKGDSGRWFAYIFMFYTQKRVGSLC